MHKISFFYGIQNMVAEADLEGGVRGVRPPKIRKAYVIQR